MKNTFNIIYLGLRNARFYMESLNLKWRHLIVVMLLGVLAISAGLYKTTKPYSDEIFQNITGIEEYIPEYRLNDDNQLVIKDGDKPIYYKSNYFQLVIDDEVSAGSNSYSLSLPSDKADLIDKDIPFSLLLFKDRAFYGIGTEQSFVDYDQFLLSNSNRMKSVVDVLNTSKNTIGRMSFIISLVQGVFAYLFLMVTISIFSGLYNIYMSRRITFSERFKLSVVVSFVPILIIELVRLFVPSFYVSSGLITILSLLLIYRTYRDYSSFIQKIIYLIQNDKNSRN